jgi:uncharacterized protein YidB (DUF937 family)
MSFIDDMKNKAVGSIADENPTVGAALEMLKNHPGGLSGLVQQFHEKGLGDVVTSWVGTGQNLPISAEQIQSVLSNEHVTAFAPMRPAPRLLNCCLRSSTSLRRTDRCRSKAACCNRA